jgi:hypothetical protein
MLLDHRVECPCARARRSAYVAWATVLSPDVERLVFGFLLVSISYVQASNLRS